jgi:site-specific DNA-methyltransferase (adenine-specific)
LDPFCGPGTAAVAAKELNRFFVGTDMETELCELAGRRIEATARRSMLREISRISDEEGRAQTTLGKS